jgi:anti-sigma factor RsiW
MSGMAPPVTENDLHAYIDDALDSERRAAVARHLDANPEEAQRVGAYIAQKQALRMALAPVAEELVPPTLQPARLLETGLRRRRVAWLVAASVALALLAGGGGGWFMRASIQRQRPPEIAEIAEEAVANHLVYTADRRHRIELSAAERDDLARWLSNRLGRTVTPPDLTRQGYRLIGARLLATQNGPAGQLMYEGGGGVPLTIYVRPMPGGQSTPIERIEDVQDTDGCAWIEKGLGFGLIADASYAELVRLAKYVRAQLQDQGDARGQG